MLYKNKVLRKLQKYGGRLRNSQSWPCSDELLSQSDVFVGNLNPCNGFLSVLGRNQCDKARSESNIKMRVMTFSSQSHI